MLAASSPRRDQALSPASARALLRRLACGAALGALVPTLAAAQNAPAAPETAESAVIEDVVVVARRREERAQSVPIPITTASSENLQRQDLRTIGDIERSVPGLSLCCGRGQASSPFMRGVPGVVGYFAGVPAPLDGGGQLFDISGVQVLKGPQGTLFGLSTNGGAILYEPVRPGDIPGGRLSVVAGSRDRLTVEGAADLPLSDQFSVRLSGQAHRADGYIEDVRSGLDLGQDKWFVGRASAIWRPSDRLENYTVVDYWRSTGRPYSAVVRAVNPTGYFRYVFGAAAADAFLAQQQALGSYKIPGLSTADPARDDRQLKVINETTFEIAPTLTLKNIAGYVESREFSRYDRAGMPFPLMSINVVPTEKPEPSRQYSEELQLTGSALDGRLDFVAGAFASGTDRDPTVAYNTVLGARSGTRSTTQARTQAIYAEGQYDLSGWLPGLSALAGYRQTWDERRAAQQQLNAAGQELSSYDQKADWSAGTYRIGLEYAPTRRTMIYLVNSRGYSSGGFNLTAPEALRVYEPESLNNFELGVKSDWTVGGLAGRVNLSAYFGQYKDIQVQVTSRVETPTGPVVAVVTQNAAEGEIKGVEGEFTLIPASFLEFWGNFSWMDAQYTRYQGLDPTGAKVVDLNNTAFVYTPEWKYSLGLRYTAPIPAEYGSVFATADYSWQDEAVTGAHVKPVPFYYVRPAFETLNLSLTWRDVLGRPGVEATVFATNVTENDLSNGGFNVYNVLGVWALNVAEPRSFGLRLTYRY